MTQTTNCGKCIACLRGLIGECNGSYTEGTATEAATFSEDGSYGFAYDPRSSHPQGSSSEDDEGSAEGLQSDGESNGEGNEEGKRKRRNKRDAALRDQQSTGRKRAARLYPLDRNAECEWAGRSSAGGGEHPIPGCGVRGSTVKGKQQARHHGPDKNTLNNEEGNVHRICHSCHNAWHALNDLVRQAKARSD